MIWTVPTPPSVNALYANIAGIGRVKTSRYRMWRRQALKAFKGLGAPITHPVMVAIEVWHDDDKKVDIDNFLKASVDILVAAQVIKDDSLVVEVRAAWSNNLPKRRTTIEVTDRDTPEDWRRIGKQTVD